MELLEELVRIDRAVNALEARRAIVLAKLEATPDPDGRHWIAVEVAQALAMSESTAAGWLYDAAMLMGLPRVLELAQAGELSRYKCTILTDAARDLAQRVDGDERDGLVERLLDTVLPRAASQTPAELKRSVTRAVARLSPVSLLEAELDAYVSRGITVWADRSQVTIQFQHTPDAAETILTAIDAWAARAPEDERTLDQRRADALVDICAYALSRDHHPDPPTGTGTGATTGSVTSTWQGRRPAVNVTVPLASLLGGRAGGDTPAELAGFGPISADLAREIAFDPTASWTVCVVDGQGRLLHRGAKTYRPPAAMREYVLTRDGVCSMPGCLRTARRSEIDHITAWARGGTTDPSNLQVLCPRHHRAKHNAGWQPKRLDDGSTEWLSPRGQIYSKPAHILPTGPAVQTKAMAFVTDADPPPF